MTPLDWALVAVYAVGLIAMSAWLGRGQKDETDYYLAGRNMRWPSIALSTMATQLGAISFISAPAFVGMRDGGGMKWLTYEFGVPLAMIFLISFLFPPIYRAGVVSIYEFLEERYAGSTRTIVSIVFQISRGMATGVTVYALALVLSAALGIPIWLNILITGGITVVYDMIGGMKAVIYSDVVQMIILFLGILVCSAFALTLAGGWHAVWQHIDPARLAILDFSQTGVGDGGEFGFWPMVIGGFFLYASYYGTDQSQVQRQLSAASFGEVRRALLFNGLGRFPVVVLYSGMGLFIAAFASVQPDFRAMIPADKPDLMVPNFIVHYLPAGLTGFLIVAILAAAMSSLDSALNSLSAASMRDLVDRNLRRPLSNRRHLTYSKLLTLFWGVFCTAMAFITANLSHTVIEAINKIGSLFYGPILAVFVMAIFSKRVGPHGANAGLLAGVAFNFLLWLFAADRVFWFWWNATGALTTLAVAFAVSSLPNARDRRVRDDLDTSTDFRLKETAVLGIYFVLMVAFCAALLYLLA